MDHTWSSIGFGGPTIWYSAGLWDFTRPGPCWPQMLAFSCPPSRPPRLQHAAPSVWHDSIITLHLDPILSFKVQIELDVFRKPFSLPTIASYDNLLPNASHILKPPQGQGWCDRLSIPNPSIATATHTIRCQQVSWMVGTCSWTKNSKSCSHKIIYFNKS